MDGWINLVVAIIGDLKFKAGHKIVSKNVPVLVSIVLPDDDIAIDVRIHGR